MMKKSIYQAAVLLFSCLCGMAQTAQQDFAKINQAYENYASLSFDIDYVVYSTYTSAVVEDHQSGFYKKQGTSYYSSLMGFESMVNSRESVMIDTSEKKLIVSAVKKPQAKAKFTIVDLEKSFTLFKTITTLSKNKKERGYLLEYKDKAISPYSKIEVYFSTETFLITQMVFYYRSNYDFTNSYPSKTGSKPRMSMKFNNIDTKPRFSEAAFTLAGFVKGREGHRTPVEKYKGYKIYEQN